MTQTQTQTQTSPLLPDATVIGGTTRYDGQVFRLYFLFDQGYGPRVEYVEFSVHADNPAHEWMVEVRGSGYGMRCVTSKNVSLNIGTTTDGATRQQAFETMVALLAETEG